jgi:hypothetical protein
MNTQPHEKALSSGLGDDIHPGPDLAPAGVTLKLNHTISQGKQGVILAYPDVLAGMKFCTQLSYKDIPGQDLLASKTLHPAALTGAVPTVP